MPYIAMLAEHNVRRGYFELDQPQAILKPVRTNQPYSLVLVHWLDHSGQRRGQE